MRNLANFLAFQGAWFAAVEGAARGWTWLGPVAVAAIVALHLALVPAAERRRELVYVLGVGLAGGLLDSVLKALGATAYPTSDPVPAWLVPAWIASLWAAFATLPRFSLGWLRGRPVLAAVLGAAGGPLSYYGGTRLGAVAAGEPALLTWGGLALEYALVTPLLLHLAPRPAASAEEAPANSPEVPLDESPQHG